MDKNNIYTTISISKDTRTRLQLLMKYGETYDSIINKLCNYYKS